MIFITKIVIYLKSRYKIYDVLRYHFIVIMFFLKVLTYTLNNQTTNCNIKKLIMNYDINILKDILIIFYQ